MRLGLPWINLGSDQPAAETLGLETKEQLDLQLIQEVAALPCRSHQLLRSCRLCLRSPCSPVHTGLGYVYQDQDFDPQFSLSLLKPVLDYSGCEILCAI